MILTIYDRLQQAAEAGTAYETILDPPPASPAVAHPPREVEARPVPEPIHPAPNTPDRYRC